MPKISTLEVKFYETVTHRQTFGCIDKNGRYKVRKRTKELPLIDESFYTPLGIKVSRGPVIFRECRALSERFLTNRPITKISKALASPSWRETTAIDQLPRVEEFSEEAIKRLYEDASLDLIYPKWEKKVPSNARNHFWKRVVLSSLHLEQLTFALGAHSIQKTASKTYCITYFRDSECQRKYDDSLIVRLMRKLFASLLNGY